MKQVAQPSAVGERAMDVTVLHWPAEAGRREELARARQPRLLLVGEEDLPPDVTDCLEDWLRVPVFERDILARTASLAARAGRHGRVQLVDGVLSASGAHVRLSSVDMRLVECFLERAGSVVAREDLTVRAWDGPVDRNLLDVHILRLRRRIAPLGLEIRTVRQRGYLLQFTEHWGDRVP